MPREEGRRLLYQCHVTHRVSRRRTMSHSLCGAGCLTSTSSGSRARVRSRSRAPAVLALQGLLTSWQRQSTRRQAKEQLLKAVDGTERGQRLGSRPAVEAAIDALAAVDTSGPPNTDAKVLSSCWRLLYTSERETLFLLKNGFPFLGAAGESYQVIDVEAGTLSNVILFGDAGAAVVVRARTKAENPVRTRFEFTAAELHVPGRKAPFSIPPFGSGWFDSLYVDAPGSGAPSLRAARDSRGDTLVVERCDDVRLPFL